jgi:hypothetical protein
MVRRGPGYVANSADQDRQWPDETFFRKGLRRPPTARATGIG